MDIKITAQDYFEELRLIKQQYGLEEELYPLINILLRSRKDTNDLSIRSVAKGRRYDTEIGRVLLFGVASFPDLAILGKGFDKTKGKDNLNKIYGCVEAKPINVQSLLISKDVESADINIPNNIANDTLEISKKSVYSESFSLIKKNGKGTDAAQLFGELFWYGKMLYTNGLVWKYLEVTECTDNKEEAVDLRNILYEECIEKQEKVKWCDVINNKKLRIKINCKTICDLSGCYNEYKEWKNNNFDKSKTFCGRKYLGNIKNEFVSKEWKKLIEELEKIEWIQTDTSEESSM